MVIFQLLTNGSLALAPTFTGGSSLNNLGTVSSEGGPLLITDAVIAQSWRGATFVEEDDYERVCDILIEAPEAEGILISIAEGKGLIWEMAGSGTSDVFLKNSTHLVVVRTWLDDPDDTETIALFANAPLQEHQHLGSLRIETGIVTILWAPESGQGITPKDFSGYSTSIQGLSVGGSGLLVKLEPGDYQCLHDEIPETLGLGEARRLHLIML